MVDDEMEKPPAVELSEPLCRAVARILGRMKKPEMFIRLAELIDDVGDETGFGDVKIIIRDGFIEYLRSEKAYKS